MDASKGDPTKTLQNPCETLYRDKVLCEEVTSFGRSEVSSEVIEIM